MQKLEKKEGKPLPVAKARSPMDMSSAQVGRDSLAAEGTSNIADTSQASYLKDLRSYRPPRPSGARPPPLSRRSIAVMPVGVHPEKATEPTGTSSGEMSKQASSLPSHRRAQSDVPERSSPPGHLGRALVQPPSLEQTSSSELATKSETRAPGQYLENGMRWMERQEAHSLRRALEDMDLAEDARIHKAAQAEASELVWKHQNPTPASAPYRYRDHLRKGSYNRVRGTIDQQRSPHPQASLSRRSISGEKSETLAKVSARTPSDATSGPVQTQDRANESLPQTLNREGDEEGTVQAKVKLAESIFSAGRRRISGSSMRKSSGNSTKGTFSDPNDKIYEEAQATSFPKGPPAPSKVSPIPARRNPFARMQFARANSAALRPSISPVIGTKADSKPLEKVEIQRNPPTQSRNPLYTANTTILPPVEQSQPLQLEDDSTATKEGKEVRSDDIRAATSMRLKDRSPHLPTPVFVSDSPGRPIVSFKEARTVELRESKPQEIPRQPHHSAEVRPLPQPRTVPSKPSTLQQKIFEGLSSHDESSTDQSFVSLRASSPRIDTSRHNTLPTIQTSPSKDASALHTNKPGVPSRPQITVTGVQPQAPTVIVDSVSTDVPSITIAAPSTVPTVKADGTFPAAAISNSKPRPVPAIQMANDNSAQSSGQVVRPLPMPKKPTIAPTQSKPLVSHPTAQSSQDHHHTRHLSLAGPVRSAALCTSCALPISGRIVSAAGARFHPECFTCHHCNEALECVAFYPEPDGARADRIARIRARASNTSIDRPSHGPNSTDDARLEEQDGYDEGLRFYCHLDFHELFSPRCKSCSTPIEGEVVLACGGTWHKGHFFCAQCGDPFEARTPFVERDGYAWCVGCHTNRFSSKCRKCRKPIVDTVIKAVGADWHEKCFVCGECGGDFVGGTYFVREGQGSDGRGGNVVCSRCEERRLKA